MANRCQLPLTNNACSLTFLVVNLNTQVWLHRWVGDAIKVQASAKTVVKTRKHGETGEPAHVQIPDHLDILAELACGAQAHIVMSDVTGR